MTKYIGENEQLAREIMRKEADKRREERRWEFIQDNQVKKGLHREYGTYEHSNFAVTSAVAGDGPGTWRPDHIVVITNEPDKD
jgi:hypothetical protein